MTETTADQPATRRSRGTGNEPAPSPGDDARTGKRVQRAAAIVALALFLAFVLRTAVNWWSAHHLASVTAEANSMAPAVDVVTARPIPPRQALGLPGDTAAWYEATIYARVDGYVKNWYVDIGDHVHAGQILATIETPELDAQLASAQAKLQAAKADFQVREAEAAFAASTYQRWKDAPHGVVSEQEREDKKAGYASAEARVAAARAAIALQQGDIDRLTAFEQFKQVVAPFAGTIVQRRIDIGNLVTAGSTANTTPLYRITQDDPIRVFVDVPQSAAASMAVGTPAQITVPSLSGRSFEGRITRTSSAVDPQSRTLRVEVDIPNKSGALLSGLYVNVNFDVAVAGRAEVPAAALLYRAKGPEVAVIEGDRVRFRRVEIAQDNGAFVDLATGIGPGDRVVLNIADQIVDGDKVRAVDSERGAASLPPAS